LDVGPSGLVLGNGSRIYLDFIAPRSNPAAYGRPL